jgi:ORF6N domain
MKALIPAEVIERKIYLIRGHKVMLDKDLAVLYGVKPIRLREQVKRNIRRFPDDFMFQLNEKEIDFMVSQNAIPSRKYLGGSQPYVFTEQGVAMLSDVLWVLKISMRGLSGLTSRNLIKFIGEFRGAFMLRYAHSRLHICENSPH